MEIETSMRITKGIIIVCAIGVGICACLMLIFAQASNPVTEADLPAGYKILCSIEGDKFGVRFPPNLVFPKGQVSCAVRESKRDAIDYAISHEEQQGKKQVYESDKYKWVECPVED